ncbi:MAG: ABC transporter permease [Roseiflexaceae bacterium]|nr:ABC transporter permease [Roseiflexaceae bacterium]
MRRFLVVFRSLLKINLRDKAALFWGFAFPIGLILLYGTIWGGQDFNGVSAMTWLTVGVVVLNIMASGFIGDATWLTQMRAQGILLRVQAAPLPRAVLVAAYGAVRLVIVLIQAAAIVLVAMLVFGAKFSLSGVALAFVIALGGAAVFILLGQAIAALAPSTGASMAIGQCIYFPLMFLSNLFIPIESLPAWLYGIARWNPAYMLVDLMRPVMVAVPAQQASWLNLLGLLLYGLLGIMIAARFFRWEPKR